MIRHPLRRLVPLMLSAALLGTAALAVETAPESKAAPIAQDQSIETCKNVSYCGKLTAADPQGEAVTFRLVDNPARGRVEVERDGAFVYTPYENKTGKDKFTFTATDSAGNESRAATVSIRIRKPATKVTYADMDGEASCNAAIRLAEKNVMVGEQVGGSYYFRPHETVSRSQFITMAMAALGREPLSQVTATGFGDDDAIPSWCKGYVSAALLAGVVQGYPDQRGRVVFDPDAVITRGEAAVMLDRMLEVTDAAVTTFYPDTLSAPAWAFQAAVNLESAGVLTTSSTGALALEEGLTRGEAAQLLAAAMELVDARETTGWFNWW